jgi:TPR repeat protein
MKLKLSAIACLFAISTSAVFAAPPANKGVSFEMMALNDSQLPAIQIYLAERATERNEYGLAANKYIRSIELGISTAVWNLMKFVNDDKLSGSELKQTLQKIKAMATDNVQLSLFLADYYHSTDNHNSEAFHWMNNSMRLGTDGVSEIMANYILDGVGGADEHYTAAEAATLLRKSSDEGSGSAAFKLAQLFDNGEVISKNLGQARHYYEVAAERGQIEAFYRLAYFKEHGIGGKADPSGAIKLYSSLLNTEFAPEVHYRMSRIFMYNESTFENSRIDGLAHLIKAAELGDSDALYKVGVASYYGSDGFKVNISKAIEHLAASAHKGNKLAAQRLVQIYTNGDRDIKPNQKLKREFQRILTEAPKT